MSAATGTKRPIRASMATPPPTPKDAVSAEVKKLATTRRAATAQPIPSGRRPASAFKRSLAQGSARELPGRTVRPQIGGQDRLDGARPEADAGQRPAFGLGPFRHHVVARELYNLVARQHRPRKQPEHRAQHPGGPPRDGSQTAPRLGARRPRLHS